MSHGIWSHVFGLDWHCLGHNKKKSLFVLLCHNLGWFPVSLFWLIYRCCFSFAALGGSTLQNISVGFPFGIMVTKIILYVYFNESDCIWEIVSQKLPCSAALYIVQRANFHLHFDIQSLGQEAALCWAVWTHHGTGFVLSNLKQKKWFPSKNVGKWTLTSLCFISPPSFQWSGVFTNCKISSRHCSLFGCSDCFPSDVKGFPDLGSNT